MTSDPKNPKPELAHQIGTASVKDLDELLRLMEQCTGLSIEAEVEWQRIQDACAAGLLTADQATEAHNALRAAGVGGQPEAFPIIVSEEAYRRLTEGPWDIGPDQAVPTQRELIAKLWRECAERIWSDCYHGGRYAWDNEKPAKRIEPKDMTGHLRSTMADCGGVPPAENFAQVAAACRGAGLQYLIDYKINYIQSNLNDPMIIGDTRVGPFFSWACVVGRADVAERIVKIIGITLTYGQGLSSACFSFETEDVERIFSKCLDTSYFNAPTALDQALKAKRWKTIELILSSRGMREFRRTHISERDLIDLRGPMGALDWLLDNRRQNRNQVAVRSSWSLPSLMRHSYDDRDLMLCVGALLRVAKHQWTEEPILNKPIQGVSIKAFKKFWHRYQIARAEEERKKAAND
jgi:hypothetical protein